MIVDSSKPLLPFSGTSSYPPERAHYRALSTSSGGASSPPPFARQSSAALVKGALASKKRLGFLLATILYLYVGSYWITTGSLPSVGVAKWTGAGAASLTAQEQLAAGATIQEVALNEAAQAEVVLEEEPEVVEEETKAAGTGPRPGLTELGAEADEVYKLTRPSLAAYQATLEHFIGTHFPPADSDLADPDSLISAMRSFFPSSRSEDGPWPLIPKTLYQTAPTQNELSSPSRIAARSWERLNPGYQHAFVDDEQMDAWVRDRFGMTSIEEAAAAKPRRRVKRQDDGEDELTFDIDEPLVEEVDVEEEEEGVITFEPVQNAQEEEEDDDEDLLEEAVDEQDELDSIDADEAWVEDGPGLRGIVDAWDLMANPPVLRADLWRYLILATEGGFYADTDVTCLKPMDIWPLDASMDREAPQGFVPPALIVGVEADVGARHDWQKWWPRPLQFSQWTMASARGHPVVLDAIRRVVESTFDDYAEEMGYHMTRASLMDGHSHAIQTNVNVVNNKKSELENAKPKFKSVMEKTGPGPWTDAILEWVGVRYGVEWADLRALEDDGWRGGDDRSGDIKILSITGFSPGVNHMGSKEKSSKAALASHAFAGSWHKQEGATRPDEQ